MNLTYHVNTWDTYYNYEMHTRISFYVLATDDVKTFHVPYFSFLSLFSRAAVVGLEEAKRKQKG